MKIESRVFLGTGIFFGGTLAVYWFTSYEDAGAMMLLFTVCLGLLPGSYLLWWSRRMRPRPEDREEATMAQGSGSVGAFPDQSVWPLVFGVGMAFVALALAFTPWMAVIGVFLALSAAVGVLVESRRGGTV